MTQAPVIAKLFTVEQVADALGVTTACIRRWVLERRIATIKVGRLVRIAQAEIERLIEAGLRPAADLRRGNGG